MSIAQLIESLEPEQRENGSRILLDIEGMAELFSAPLGAIFQILEEAGQEVLDSIETQQQLGLYVLSKLTERPDEIGAIYTEHGDSFRQAMEAAGAGKSTDYLRDFPTFAGLVHTAQAMQRAQAA